MADKVQCPGCHIVVSVSRPPGVDYQVRRDEVEGQQRVTIQVGQVLVHRCTLCVDGEYR